MAQIDPRDLDYSPAMKEYFGRIYEALVGPNEKTPEEARELIDRYFALDVDPLERALVMHSDPERVAQDLAHMVF